ncbi:hypothetical protein C8R45DRAFT_1060628 [Mycena sanguinolenta]|nr:hypothetical protein C8R45DRAFT_1060628 [Mycena sanguinolenta]
MSLPVLHIWPGELEWGLPSVHLPSLVVALHLQLTIPGKFTISHCTNPDLSPSGALPFLTHDQQIVTSLPSIIKYISSLAADANLDAGFTSFEASQKTAWCSHVEAKLGDLVSYTLYSLPANWGKLIGLTLAYELPVPQRYYVPGRIRDMHRHRLEAAGLWLQQPPAEAKLLPFSANSDDQERIAQAFQRDKVLQTARDYLDIYTRLLGENQFVFHNRMTTLDVVLAAHVLLMIKPPFPDRLLSDLLANSYPTLVSHAERILAKSQQLPAPLHASSEGYSISSIFPSLPRSQQREKGEGETRYDREAWGWLALAAGTVGLFLHPVTTRWYSE